MNTILSLRIDEETGVRLDSLAKRTKRSKSFLAAEAIASYVEAQNWELDEIAAGLDDLEHGRTVDHEAVADWLQSWGGPHEREPPGPDHRLVG